MFMPRVERHGQPRCAPSPIHQFHTTLCVPWAETDQGCIHATGIFPRSGRNITFRDLNRLVHQTYNFAPTFCFFVPNYAANMLNRSYKTDSFDLSDLDAHNCIEHDASLLRT